MATEKEVALVTGGSRGIGRSICVALARSGRHVLVNYRSRHGEAQETLREIEESQGSAELVPFDVTDHEAVSRAAAEIAEKHGAIDILVHNAGVIRDVLFYWMKPDDWNSVLRLKLDAFYYLANSVIKGMLAERRGRIVSIVSASGQMGVAGQVNYSAANAGLIGATKALAKEVARNGITVNAVAPGFISTDMLGDLDTSDIVKTVPMRRLGRPEEVASLVVFLASSEAAYITGQVIGVNGGIC